VSVACCQVEVSATGRSVIRRSPSECAASECHLGTSTMSRLGPNRAVAPQRNVVIGQNRFNLSTRDFRNSVQSDVGPSLLYHGKTVLITLLRHFHQG
jgi:hypothetical protein